MGRKAKINFQLGSDLESYNNLKLYSEDLLFQPQKAVTNRIESHRNQNFIHLCIDMSRQ